MRWPRPGFRAIAYDRRGFGRSDQPWDGYDYDTLADDLADVLKGTGAASDAALIGFSMGGGEVARYMSRYEGKGVIAAGLISSVVPYMLKTDDNPNGVPEKDLKAIGDGIKEDRYKFFQGFFPDFYGNGWIEKDVSQGQVDWAVQAANMAGLRPILACAESFGHTDFRPDLAHSNVPTLIVHGTADKTVPIDATGAPGGQGHRQAQLVEYDGAAARPDRQPSGPLHQGPADVSLGRYGDLALAAWSVGGAASTLRRPPLRCVAAEAASFTILSLKGRANCVALSAHPCIGIPDGHRPRRRAPPVHDPELPRLLAVALHRHDRGQRAGDHPRLAGLYRSRARRWTSSRPRSCSA